jgi:3-deoxy-D-manno-octulosonic acid kinase
MSSADQFKIKNAGASYILYDASIIADPELQLFVRDYHTNSAVQQNNTASNSNSGIGRAKVVYFQVNDNSYVLKHYYRGGAVARLLKDRYIGFNIENSRAFREWRLLKRMTSLGLPVPDAVAAHVEKSRFFYRADLITREIKHSRTLAEILSESELDAAIWKAVGQCVARFHYHDVYHSDLNARNILLTEAGDIYLIDFDNSYIRLHATTWRMENLSRLKRSLLKFKKNTQGFNFDEDNWSALLAGYKEGIIE